MNPREKLENALISSVPPDAIFDLSVHPHPTRFGDFLVFFGSTDVLVRDSQIRSAEKNGSWPSLAKAVYRRARLSSGPCPTFWQDAQLLFARELADALDEPLLPGSARANLNRFLLIIRKDRHVR